MLLQAAWDGEGRTYLRRDFYGGRFAAKGERIIAMDGKNRQARDRARMPKARNGEY